MWLNSYGNAVERWKVELIVARARRLGFRRQDLEDVQQDLVLDVMSFDYDEARANGATERTALTSVIDRRLKTVLRAKQRYQTRLNGLEPRPEADEGQDLDQQQRAIDVRDAIGRLTPDDRDLCRALSEGQSLTEVARRTGASWHAVKRRVVRLREQFSEIGLDAWIGN